jgi:hypothetical protein
MDDAATGLPRWKCHKEVFADKIVGTACAGRELFLRLGGFVRLGHDLQTRGAPIIGGYYVRYLDGYESWSPADAFEDGYTRVA